MHTTSSASPVQVPWNLKDGVLVVLGCRLVKLDENEALEGEPKLLANNLVAFTIRLSAFRLRYYTWRVGTLNMRHQDADFSPRHRSRRLALKVS